MNLHARQDETAEWLNYLQPEGLVVGANVLRERQLTPIRQTPLDTEEVREVLGLKPDAPREDDRHFKLPNAWQFFERILGWPAKLVAGSPGGPQVPPELSLVVPEHETLLAPDMAILWNGIPGEDAPAQALVALHPGMDADTRNQFSASEWEASPHQRLERLLRETNIGVGILVARNTLRLIYAPRGETAGWISWPLAALSRVEGRPMLAGLKLCLGRNAFFTGAPEVRLRPLLRASREAQNEVSEKLSGQVLGALHELLRGLHRAAPDRIEALAESDPHHLYEGLLTCLMRLVFLLYAEDRDLLPSSPDPQLKALWESGYSIKTLYALLLADEALNPDTMDERRGGWGQLLAVFRLVFEGHPKDPEWIARRGGKLFDPDVFPFLEGRERGSPRGDGNVLPVSDGTILRILHGLMTVDARSLSGEKIRERLSYRSLDVESIGSVYETVMGFTAKRAAERMIALKDEKKLPSFVGLGTLLKQKPADRQKWLKEQAVKLSTKQAAGVKAAGDEAALLEAFGNLIDERASPKAAPIGAGTPYLQPTEERRRSGSHYTPRSLTAPIVEHTLEPAFERIGEKASPEDVLALKVLDPACGSGAFLVEACRQLGTRLEQAWDMHKAEKPPIPPDEDEATHARRLVAQRCLYGVDRNPMAVDLARLSLWLATLAREHEFSFLDHALKSGDSLVGLTQAEIAAANWDAAKPGLPLFRKMIKESVDKALQGREAIRNAADDILMEAQAARYARVQDASETARIVGDAVIAAFFSADKARARETARAEVESWITGGTTPKWDLLTAKAKAFRAEHDWRPFHWEVEFPEVFARKIPGFDAIVGNPPFMRGKAVGKTLGTRYRDRLKDSVPLANSSADLVSFFFRRAFDLLSDGGALGLVATKTISEGDTRRAGLRFICTHGGSIYRANRRLAWPGAAAVSVATVHILKGPWSLPSVLDNKVVPRITAFLFHDGGHEDPADIAANSELSFNGCAIAGVGFTFDDSEPRATSIAEMRFLEAKDARNAERIFPFVGGDEINGSPTHATQKCVIFFADMSLEHAEQWPDLVKILREKVKPERDKADRAAHRQKWWQFGDWRPGLFHAISQLDRMLCVSFISEYLGFAWIPTDRIVSHNVGVFATDRDEFFCVVQSRVHEYFARRLSSGLEERPGYRPSDGFEPYPFPTDFGSNLDLAEAGRQYYAHRAKVMHLKNEGLTRVYSRFHNANERGPEIERLRELHDGMDRAVLRAYGWEDLADTLKPQFLTEETEDDHTYQNRYFWPAEQRDLVLSRLLALNAQRHAEEVATGVAPTTAKRRAAADDGDDDAQDSLDLE